VLAIKQVPVDTDLQEIIKEISIMQQCDSPWVVKYYGSYFKNTDLWVSRERERERERECHSDEV
jgi:serine/threonine protein kinase